MRIFTDPLLFSIIFLSWFLYWAWAPTEKIKRVILIVASYLIFAILHWQFAIGTFLILILVHRASIYLNKVERPPVLALMIAAVTSLLLVFKYGQSIYTQLFGQSEFIDSHLIMPLGISYFCFRIIQYLLDSYRKILNEHSFVKLIQFIMFFPTIPAGPIETYQEFYAKQSIKFDVDLMSFGLKRILWGFFKKFFFLELIYKKHIFSNAALSVDAPTALDSLHFVSSMFVFAYIDLSAYSDIAIGLSACFGFRIVENFKLPLLKTNLSQFWNSWHISLSSWCRNNVYFPVFGVTRKPWLGMYASMFTMGLWHYVNINWVLWALYHGSGLVILVRWEKFKRKKKRLKKFMQTWPIRILCWAFTFWFVAIGYSFAGTHDFASAKKLLIAIFSPF